MTIPELLDRLNDTLVAQGDEPVGIPLVAVATVNRERLRAWRRGKHTG